MMCRGRKNKNAVDHPHACRLCLIRTAAGHSCTRDVWPGLESSESPGWGKPWLPKAPALATHLSKMANLATPPGEVNHLGQLDTSRLPVFGVDSFGLVPRSRRMECFP